MRMKNSQYTSFSCNTEREWSISCMMWWYVPWHNTNKPHTQERLRRAPGTECVFHSLHYTNTVISIDSSIWREEGWWMMCTTVGDTVPQKGQRYEKELGKVWHICTYKPMCVCRSTHHTQVYTQACESPLMAPFIACDPIWRVGPPAEKRSLKLPTRCRFVWKRLPTNVDFVSIVPTENHFVWVLPTESCFCFKVTHRKF